MKKQLDERNIELSKMLFTLKQSIDLEKILGLNADYINNSGCGKHFFAHLQRLTIESCVINICKIFEMEKQYSLNSIPSILKFINENNIQPSDSNPINKFIEKYGNCKRTEENYICLLEKICSDFYHKHQIPFKRYDYARDKIIAHAECNAQQDSLPSHVVMKNLLLFGIDFYHMITNSYIDNVNPYPIQDNTDVFSSTHKVFKKLGIENIKTEFDK